MAAHDPGGKSPTGSSEFRHSAVFIPVLAAILILFAMIVFADLAPWRVVIGIAVIIAAACIGYVWSVRGVREFVSPEIVVPSGRDVIEGLIAALPDAVIVLDGQGRVVALNAQAGAIAPALRIGEPVSLALRVPEVVEAIRRVTATRSAERVEFSERVPSDRWLEAFVQPLAPELATEGAHILLTFHDLTPIRRVEEMRADFIANASHELRTPLAALSGFIETLRGPAREDAATRERFLAIMEAQATRMARLIDDLLSLSRIELNAHRRPDNPVDLIPVVRQVCDALQTLARDREVEVIVHAPGEPLVVRGDRDELVRVFENLIENALKYGASGKRVEVDISRAAGEGVGEAVVAVRDFGPGIAAEHLPRLTERFYRVDVAGSRAQGGTGLGLALVKHILNRHRGRLTIESKVGQGATFTVRLSLMNGAGASSVKP
jgi:two-component system phosphate regulon sensor histidine kinase PhoR